MKPLFYDVPCVNHVSEKTGMLYMIFDCPFAAMSFAARNGLLVNRRQWDSGIFARTRIGDLRGVY